LLSIAIARAVFLGILVRGLENGGDHGFPLAEHLFALLSSMPGFEVLQPGVGLAQLGFQVFQFISSESDIVFSVGWPGLVSKRCDVRITVKIRPAILLFHGFLQCTDSVEFEQVIESRRKVESNGSVHMRVSACMRVRSVAPYDCGRPLGLKPESGFCSFVLFMVPLGYIAV
jgi:hypothetical protein